jgi:hypothetical protein
VASSSCCWRAGQSLCTAVLLSLGCWSWDICLTGWERLVCKWNPCTCICGVKKCRTATCALPSIDVGDCHEQQVCKSRGGRALGKLVGLSIKCFFDGFFSLELLACRVVLRHNKIARLSTSATSTAPFHSSSLSLQPRALHICKLHVVAYPSHSHSLYFDRCLRPVRHYHPVSTPHIQASLEIGMKLCASDTQQTASLACVGVLRVSAR